MSGMSQIMRALHHRQTQTRLGLVIVSAMFAALATSAWTKASYADTLPKVRILATGGTIAGQVRDDGTGGYDASKLSIDAILAAVPELGKVAQISSEQVVQVSSQDMTDAIWLKLHGRVEAALSDPSIAGVVITHGTDTMEETAFFLDRTVKGTKPVVLVGAMRPATGTSADGPLNLLEAVRLAASPEARGRGCMVVMDETIHAARDVTKTHTTGSATFQSPNMGAIGHFYKQMPRFWHPAGERGPVFALGKRNKLPRVEIVYGHANMTGVMIEAAVRARVAGIVIAGTGNGNFSAPAMAAIDKARRRGVVIVRSSRVGSGRVDRNVELDDDAKGYVAAGILNPQKARILLMLALTRGKNVAEVQKHFFSLW